MTVAIVALMACEGPIGKTGPQGPQGPEGDPGAHGSHGTHGTDGETGEAGEAGPQGPAGMDGYDALEGRDAIIEIPLHVHLNSSLRHDIKQYFRGGREDLVYTLHEVKSCGALTDGYNACSGSAPKFSVSIPDEDGFVTITVLRGGDAKFIAVIRASEPESMFYAEAYLTIRRP